CTVKGIPGIELEASATTNQRLVWDWAGLHGLAFNRGFGEKKPTPWNFSGSRTDTSRSFFRLNWHCGSAATPSTSSSSGGIQRRRQLRVRVRPLYPITVPLRDRRLPASFWTHPNRRPQTEAASLPAPQYSVASSQSHLTALTASWAAAAAAAAA
uniref:Myotubularin phosphatase domain-containing protein n=1 Tax=Macrostomum lignano TaxID=282301 RepID=A0A1I8IM79_9PLAT